MSVTPKALTHLGDMPIERFFKDFWQKKPLLIQNAFSELPDLGPNEIAGFALEEDVESRILIETPTGPPLQSQWAMHLGPQKEDIFEQLPNTHWTLLVQAVDQLSPDVQDLLHKFRFIPNWRVDDIMVSYAPDQGNVGPHFDYYDVFLLQAQGSRLWKLGPKCDSSSELRQDTDCKILTHFSSEQEWLVNPGDLLYIPAQFSHWGIAQGECVTYSIGFRAPSYSEILLDFSQELASLSTEDQRYRDKNLTQRTNSGEICPEDIKNVKSIILNLIDDEEKLSQWFASYMTQAKRDSPTFEPVTKSNYPILAPNCRAAYIKNTSKDSCALFINGDNYNCSLVLAESICAYTSINTENFCPTDKILVQQLVEDGILLCKEYET